MQEQEKVIKKKKKNSSFDTGSSFNLENLDIEDTIEEIDDTLTEEEEVELNSHLKTFALNMLSGLEVSKSQAQKAGVKVKKKLGDCGCDF